MGYENGKIYMLRCLTTGLIYVGSTIQTLSSRLSGHKKDYKRFLDGRIKEQTTSFKILENNNFAIELLEDYPCSGKNELRLRERFHINSLPCVNKVQPTRTQKEYWLEYKTKDENKKKRREWLELNKDKIKEYSKNYRKKYYQDHRDTILQKQKENIEHRRHVKHQWNLKNKEKVKEYNRLYRMRKKSEKNISNV